MQRRIESDPIQQIVTQLSRPKIENKITNLIGGDASINSEVRQAIIDLSPDLFSSDWPREKGYKIYIRSNNSQLQFWGAAAKLIEAVIASRNQGGRNLSSGQLEYCSRFFKKAAEKRKIDHQPDSHSYELVAQNVPILVEITNQLIDQEFLGPVQHRY